MFGRTLTWISGHRQLENSYYRDGEPDVVLVGSAMMPRDLGRLPRVVVHVPVSVTEVRRAVPGARWHVRLDVPRDEDEGHALPGMRDPGLTAELGVPAPLAP